MSLMCVPRPLATVVVAMLLALATPDSRGLVEAQYYATVDPHPIAERTSDTFVTLNLTCLEKNSSEPRYLMLTVHNSTVDQYNQNITYYCTHYAHDPYVLNSTTIAMIIVFALIVIIAAALFCVCYKPTREERPESPAGAKKMKRVVSGVQLGEDENSDQRREMTSRHRESELSL